MTQSDQNHQPADDPKSTPPSLIVVWDPALVTPQEYASLITAVGDMVRARGGIGVVRIGAHGVGLPAPTGVPT